MLAHIMRAEGIEPPRSFEHQDLNLACLPGSSTPANHHRSLRTQGIVIAVADKVLIHPNRDKAESKATKAAEIVSVAYILIYLGMAFVVSRWNRGVLPVAAALAILFAVLAAVAAPGWFERDKAGFDDPMLEPALLGMLTVIIIPVQLLLIAFAMRGFQQQWNVEVEVTSDEADRYRGGDRSLGQTQPA